MTKAELKLFRTIARGVRAGLVDESVLSDMITRSVRAFDARLRTEAQAIVAPQYDRRSRAVA